MFMFVYSISHLFVSSQSVSLVLTENQPLNTNKHTYTYCQE